MLRCLFDWYRYRCDKLIEQYFYNKHEYFEWRDRVAEHKRKEYYLNHHKAAMEMLYYRVLAYLSPHQNVRYRDDEVVYIGKPNDPIEDRILYGKQDKWGKESQL